MISVNIKFFGPLRDVMRSDEISVELPDQCTGERAFDILASGHPELVEWKQSVRLAVNLEYRPFGYLLKTDDEVCFVPPVSGG